MKKIKVRIFVVLCCLVMFLLCVCFRLFCYVIWVFFMDNDGVDGYFSDFYLKFFLLWFCVFGDFCFFIGLFFLLWNWIVKLKNFSFRILDYFYFFICGIIEYLLVLWFVGFVYVMEMNCFECWLLVLYRI